MCIDIVQSEITNSNGKKRRNLNYGIKLHEIIQITEKYRSDFIEIDSSLRSVELQTWLFKRKLNP